MKKQFSKLFQKIPHGIFFVILMSALGLTSQAQVIELGVGEGVYLYTPAPTSADYPWIGIATGNWDSSEAPDMGFSSIPDMYSAHAGVRRAFSGIQKISVYYCWVRISDRGGRVASPIMTKTWYFKCKDSGGGGGGVTPTGELHIIPETLELNVGDEHSMTCWAMGLSGSVNDVWSSSNTSVATVEKTDFFEAKVKAKGAGQCNISVSAGGLTATCKVTVNETGELHIIPETLELNVGDEHSMTCWAMGLSGSLNDVWSSSNTSVATVEKTDFFEAKVKAKGAGQCNISVSAGGLTATCKVTVNETGIAIDASNFPDANFRQYLLGTYEGKDGKLVKKEIEGLTRIDVSEKNISSLKGIELLSSVKMLFCYNNQLTALDVSKNTELTNLYCYNNQLTALDVSQNTALKYLYCGINQLTALDVSQNTALLSLSCYKNQLTALDVSKNTALKYLNCGINQLTALDVSQNTELTNLSCDNNQLTALDVSMNTALKNLGVSNNQIKDAEMDALISSLPNNAEVKSFCVIDNRGNEGNICTKEQVAAAKEKGWIAKYWDGTEYEGSEKIVILPQEISMSGAGYATFYSSESAYSLPRELSAQVVVNVSNEKLVYQTVAEGSSSGVIPKGTAVMLKSGNKQKGDFTLTPSESTTLYYGTNLLHGSDEPTTTTGDGLHYKLTFGPSADSKLKDAFGWYWGAQNGAPFQIEGHKAWLVVPQGNGTRAAGFSIDGDVLGIEALGDGINSPLGNYFDLQGRRIQRPTRKGIYISNGKKIVNK